MMRRLSFLLLSLVLCSVCATANENLQSRTSSNLQDLGTQLVDLSSIGLPALMSYQFVNGHAELVHFDTKTKKGERTWQGDIDKGWTSIIPYGNEKKSVVLLYNSKTGNAQYLVFSKDGKTITALPKLSWSLGWTSLEYFSFDNRDFLARYNQTNGNTRINEIRPSMIESDNIYETQWRPKRTDIRVLNVDDNVYIFLYNGKEGKVVVSQLEKKSHTFDTSGKWWGAWNKQKSKFNVVTHKDETYLIRHVVASKTLQVWQYSQERGELINIGSRVLNGYSDALTVILLNQTPHLVLYTNGTYTIVKFSFNLKDFDQVWRGSVK